MFSLIRNDIASKLGISSQKLTHILYVTRIENCYTSYSIPKKNGGYRDIHVPNASLKKIQKRLAAFLYNEQKEMFSKRDKAPNISHGFEKGKGIISNAKIHRKKKIVLNIDLEDFFDSFHFGRVRGYFQKNKHFNMSIERATVIAQLTCYNGSLPQGAPTSPIITNLICQILDFKVLRIAKKYKLDYTRYADDLTFSTNDSTFIQKTETFLDEIRREINRAGFKINDKKVRLEFKDSKQKVTGIVVNEKLSIDRKYVRDTKAMAHALYTKGFFTINGDEGTINQLEGRFSFINQLDKLDNQSLSKDKRNCHTLNGREREYQKFLFYRYFFNNDKPLIITEGKTDILYLKSALRKYYQKYPHLIRLGPTGKFEYKVLFYNRTPKMKYFFGITGDGADTINNIYKYYTRGYPKNHRHLNYRSYFNAYGIQSKSPVFLLFDNELDNKSKPIRKFEGYTKLSDTQKEAFSQNLWIQLLEGANLYLITNPLCKGKPECEIEDLFPENVLSYKINGKEFSRDEKYCTTTHYGKDIFSKMIYKNYQTIDFSEFEILLDKINAIVIEYETALTAR